MSYVDPPEAEASGLRTKDLKNRVVVLKPTGTGEAEGQDGSPWRWVLCDAWVLNPSGVEAHGEDLRVSWKRMRPQLEGLIGQYVAGKVVENDDNSITLIALSAEARKIVDRVMPEITGQSKLDDGTEPF
jgi:hypothetical protein